MVALCSACGTQRFVLAPNTDDSDDPIHTEKSSGEEDSSVKKGGVFEVFPVEISVKKVDILIVVDNSTTMNSANMELKEKIAPLISEISASNWQIAVTTSTITDCLRGIMKKGESNLGEFKEIIGKVHSRYLSSTDLDSSNNEQVVKMAKRALEGMPIAKNAGNKSVNIDCSDKKQHWLRPDSLLVILMITDEDVDDLGHPYGGLPTSDRNGNPADYRCCTDPSCKQRSCIDDFYDYLSTIRVPHVSAKLYGILDNRDNGTTRTNSYNRSDLYLQWRDSKKQQPFFDAVHNLYLPTRTELNNFDIIFKKISANISSSLENIFVLKKVYDPKTTQVILTKTDNSKETLPPDTYTIDDKVLEINEKRLIDVRQIRIEKIDSGG